MIKLQLPAVVRTQFHCPVSILCFTFPLLYYVSKDHTLNQLLALESVSLVQLLRHSVGMWTLTEEDELLC